MADSSQADRYWFYERAVQAPARLVPFLLSLHGGRPRRLREDFCARARLCDAWIEAVSQGEAVGIDRDPELLAGSLPHPRKVLFAADLRGVHPRHAPCDLVFVGNFSIGELHSRAALVRYLRAVREQTAAGGLLVIDTYGGPSAWRTGSMQRMHLLPDGRRIQHVWEQRAIDPRTQQVVNALHFRLEDRGEIVAECSEAFVYRWRLWSLAELADAAEESGWGTASVHPELDAQPACPESESWGESWAACSVWRRT